MCHRPGLKLVSFLSVFLLMFSSVQASLANLHPLSRVDTRDVDVTISLDWDPASYTTPEIMTKAGFGKAVNSYAASLYAMTNGLHRLRNVYVYKNKRFWDLADMRYVGKAPGRSQAYVASWQIPNKEITMYVYEKASVLDGYPGPVMGHESGHYIYGVLDEYQEAKGGEYSYTIKELIKKGLQYMPATDDDGTQPSIMNYHMDYQNWFSVFDTYTAANKKNSAQYRTYGKSIWDTLTTDPKDDPPYVLKTFDRTQFEVFKGKKVTSSSDLKIDGTAVPQTGEVKGYDAALNIVWADDAPVLNQIVLDTNITDTSWSAALDSAAEYVQRMPAKELLQVLTGDRIALAAVTVTAGNRTDQIAKIKQIKKSAAVTVERTLQAAASEIETYYKTPTPRKISKLTLIAMTNPPVSKTLAGTLKDRGVILDILSFDPPEAAAGSVKAVSRSAPTAMNASSVMQADTETIYLSQLARVSGGSFITARTATDLENAAAKAAGETREEYGLAIINEQTTDTLASGRFTEMPVIVGSNDPFPMIIINASTRNFGQLIPTLIDPQGTEYSDVDVPHGIIAFGKDEDTSDWLIMIDSLVAKHGVWKVKVTATADVSDGFTMQATAASPLQLRIDVTQRPIVGNLLEASLSSDRPIVQARVHADIYNQAGEKIRTGVILYDDATHGDARRDDGVYTTTLNDLPPGEYSFTVTADDNNNQAVASDRGVFFNASKTPPPDEATGPFQRIDVGTFAVSAQADSSGGGCAIGRGSSPDLLLLLAAICPLLYLSVARRREEGSKD